MKIVLVHCAPTEWRQEDRLLGRVELPMAEGAAQQCAAWADRLRALDVEKIYHSPDELATDTARLLSDSLDVPAKSIDHLAEVDVGLWAGLPGGELRKRYASAHEMLCDAPLHVSPPEGEDLCVADVRLRAGVQKILKKNGQHAIALVLRPLAFAMLRRAIGGGDESTIWETTHEGDDPVVLEFNGAPTALAAK
jgi:broad specificity phosphatase PhoE